ncbi:tRNA dihydrouridine synthase [Geothermobacter hydrogeniphilus]|nr:tRNA-dihydrouridine synthase family protein [Geothermobacter hydrogeniphilus]
MNASANHKLPWAPGTVPLMLAPMQGLTNSAMRRLVIDRGRPEVVFTEFLRVSGVSRRRFGRRDIADIAAEQDGVPLVVQLVGHGVEPLVDAALIARDNGARHLNLNLGCPYGRMTTAATGGALLQYPERLAELLPALRRAIAGGFSVKLRAGYEDLRQIFSLLPLLEDAGVDWLVLHPRTVVQKYAGAADHRLTAEVVARTRLPVIANGDIRSAAEGRLVLERTGAAGLMIGRAAMADPLIFARLRGAAPEMPDLEQQARDLRGYLQGLLPFYRERFCGEKQVLDKMKNVLLFIDQPAFADTVRRLKKSRTIPAFARLLEDL